MSFESRLRQESPGWVAAGVISPEQAQRIHALHPESEGAAASRFLTIISLLGAALCAVGVALIISANWQDIHRWVKITALLALLAGAYGGGYWLKFQRADFPKLGEALIMAGCVLFLLGIALVSQIFHLGGRAGNAVLVWMAGIAAIPFLARAKGAFFVLLVAVYSWLVIESTVRDGWLRLAASPDSSAGFSLPFVLLGGSLALYWAASFWPEAWQGFARMQQAWPLAVICGTVYAAGFTHKSWWNHDGGLLREPALLLVAVAVLAGALAAWRNWGKWRLLSPWLVLAAAPALIALGNLLGNDVRIATSALSWITLLVLNVFMARAGLSQGRPWLVNVALAFIALNLFTRYFDIFSSMLNQGLMFLVSGAVVLSLGWYLERKRRALLGVIRRGGAT